MRLQDATDVRYIRYCNREIRPTHKITLIILCWLITTAFSYLEKASGKWNNLCIYLVASWIMDKSTIHANLPREVQVCACCLRIIINAVSSHAIYWPYQIHVDDMPIVSKWNESSNFWIISENCVEFWQVNLNREAFNPCYKFLNYFMRNSSPISIFYV